MVSCVPFGTSMGDFTHHSNVFKYFVTLMSESPFRHHSLILSSVFVQGEKLMEVLPPQYGGPNLILGFPNHLVSNRVSTEFCLSWSSMESHSYTILGSPVPHKHSSFLEVDEENTDTTTSGSPCTLSRFHFCLISWWSCLVGVKRLGSSRTSWDLHQMYRTRVSGQSFWCRTPYLPLKCSMFH